MIFFIVPVLLVAGLLASLSVAARSSSRRARGAIIVVLVCLTPLAALAVLLAAGWEGMRCDEACGSGPGWTQVSDAWQWTAQLVICALGGAALTVSVALIVSKRYAAARLSVVVGAAAFAVWALFMAPLTSDF
jgi:hypothetical protein